MRTDCNWRSSKQTSIISNWLMEARSRQTGAIDSRLVVGDVVEDVIACVFDDLPNTNPPKIIIGRSRLRVAN
eukprot:IDg5226t1